MSQIRMKPPRGTSEILPGAMQTRFIFDEMGGREGKKYVGYSEATQTSIPEETNAKARLNKDVIEFLDGRMAEAKALSEDVSYFLMKKRSQEDRAINAALLSMKKEYVDLSYGENLEGKKFLFVGDDKRFEPVRVHGSPAVVISYFSLVGNEELLYPIAGINAHGIYDDKIGTMLIGGYKPIDVEELRAYGEMLLLEKPELG